MGTNQEGGDGSGSSPDAGSDQGGQQVGAEPQATPSEGSGQAQAEAGQEVKVEKVIPSIEFLLDGPDDLSRQIDYLQRAAKSLHERQDGHLAQCLSRLADRLSWIASEAFVRYGIRVPSVYNDETLIGRYCTATAVPEDLLTELVLEDAQREVEQLTGTYLLMALLKRNDPAKLRERIAQATAERQEILRKAEEAVCQANEALAKQQLAASPPPATDTATMPPETPADP